MRIVYGRQYASQIGEADMVITSPGPRRRCRCRPPSTINSPRDHPNGTQDPLDVATSIPQVHPSAGYNLSILSHLSRIMTTWPASQPMPAHGLGSIYLARAKHRAYH
ncbi:hypothetical protein BDV98DRAFT_568888 [Pterulicium gracile]|uniref:Uncharacterized protein n=1 Tax=Pterulicium gracile TaxID=1884261 RepID=A0A5C3QGM8_9AGAR|nr:hypothetical protein BDV98DRAFT_568888 [Pterula gracilis]